MRNRSLVVLALSICLVFSTAAIARAAAPPTSPAVIQNITFESTAASDTLALDNSYSPYINASPSAPQWGVVTAAAHSGTHSLWCAGTGGGWPYYTPGTHGMAYMRVFDASAWAQSQITFSYLEPSIGGSDSPPNPFRVSWGLGSNAATASTPPGQYSNPYLPTGSSWQTVTLDRTSAGSITPPMDGGWLRFDFLSDPGSGGGGRGTTIDDIVVTGYEFGPVNNLTATREHGNLTSVDVQWDAPYQRGTKTPDARDIWYRVWRHDVSAGTWTEVTPSRTNAHSFTDTGVPTSGAYEYVVQGWESSGNSAWGQNATSPQVGPAQIRFASPTITPAVVGYGGGSTLSATLVDDVGSPISGQQGGIVVQRSVAGGAWTTVSAGIVSEITTGTYSALVASTVSANYRLFYATGSAGSAGQHVTASAYVGTPSTPPSVKHSKNFAVSGSVSGVPGVARIVTLHATHKETKVVAGKKTTVWVQRGVFTVSVAAKDSVVSYKKTIKLAKTGSWRITASVSDAYNAAATSGFRSFTVK